MGLTLILLLDLVIILYIILDFKKSLYGCLIAAINVFKLIFFASS